MFISCYDIVYFKYSHHATSDRLLTKFGSIKLWSVCGQIMGVFGANYWQVVSKTGVIYEHTGVVNVVEYSQFDILILHYDTIFLILEVYERNNLSGDLF